MLKAVNSHGSCGNRKGSDSQKAIFRWAKNSKMHDTMGPDLL
jgi:hypothetical protein